ncbi:hypothetical protein OUZ56_004939 [Daphnia magna]|uniref:Uncharacterized protein n=1 Tax=Daphnia magna TaxID=35525 RepID=A0ABQ9YRA8_9CRUS|nr:hypothetical protein OUZ56_004939 [Daphnia magna]
MIYYGDPVECERGLRIDMYEFCFLTNSKTHGVACCLVSHLELFFLLFLLCLDAITTVVHQSL